MHEVGYLHRDLKPDNFVIGLRSLKHKLYLLDMGLCNYYVDPITGKHIQSTTGKPLIGTAKFASISTQLGMEQSRRDDLESLGYIMIYLYKGNLPWHGIQERNQKERYRLIMETKMALPIEELCSETPACFCKYLNYVRGMKFDKTPNYKLLQSLFKENMNTEIKLEPDWCIRKIEQKEEESPILSKSIIKLVKDIQAQQVIANKKVPHEANEDELSVGISHNEEEEQLKEESSIPDENDKRIEPLKSIIVKEFDNWGSITPLTAKPKKRFGLLDFKLRAKGNSQ